MTCKHCLKPVRRRLLLRQRVYCSAKCRQAYHDLGRPCRRQLRLW